MDIVFYGFVVFLFAAVILATEASYLWWMGRYGGAARRVARRLQVMSGGLGRSSERISILKQRRFSKNESVDQFLHRLTLAHRIDQLLVQSGVKWSVDQHLLTSITLALLGVALSSHWPVPIVFKSAFALALLCVPWLQARRKRRLRLIKIEEQLPEAADFIARALRAGHSFTNVLQIVGNELPEPLSGEFRLAREEINYGVPMNEALHNMAERIPLTDLRYLIIAVVIQRESGGNLAEILGNISQIIRGRLKLAAQVRVLSAEGRMSAWILGCLPFVVLVLMILINPKYIGLMWTDPIGIDVLWVACAMIMFGVFWLRQVIRIRI
jgi:tight adherence protein B